MTDREVYYTLLARHPSSVPPQGHQRMVNIDYHRELSLVAVAGRFGSERMVGVARYVRGGTASRRWTFAVASRCRARAGAGP